MSDASTVAVLEGLVGTLRDAIANAPGHKTPALTALRTSALAWFDTNGLRILARKIGNTPTSDRSPVATSHWAASMTRRATSNIQTSVLVLMQRAPSCW